MSTHDRCHLNKAVDALESVSSQARYEMDLESPMVKVLDFLKRYQSGRWQQPNVSEARRLEDLIVSHAGALTVPDLEKELKGAAMNTGITGFLIGNMHQGTGLRRSNGMESFSGIISQSDTSLQGSSHNTLLSISGREGSVLAPATDAETRDADAMVIVVPARLHGLIGKEFFLDLATPSSYFHDDGTCIQTVVQHCTDSWNLLHSATARHRLAHFTRAIEAGYPDTHCEALTCAPEILHNSSCTQRGARKGIL